MVAEQKRIELFYEVNNSDLKKGTAEATALLEKQAKAFRDEAKELEKRTFAARTAAKVDKELVKALVEESRAASQAARELEAHAKKLKDATQSTNLLDKGTQKVAGSLKSVALGAAAATVSITALAAAATKAVTTFGDFERTLNRIQATSGLSAAELKKLEKSSLDLGASTVFSAQQVADGYLNMSKAGFSASESLQAMPGILNAAAAAGGDLAGASEAITGTLRAFGLEADKATHLADLLAKADAASATSIVEVGDAFKYLAPTAAGANQTVEEMTATLAILANSMVKAGDAGTDINAILTRLQNPPKEAADALQALGVKIADSTGKMRPFLDIVKDVQEGLKKFDQVTGNKLLSDISGLNNLKSLQILTQKSTEELDSMREAMANADGAAKEMADTINKGMNTSLEQFEGAVETANIRLGQELAPTIMKVIDGLTDLISQSDNSTSAIGQLIGIVSSLIASCVNLIGVFFDALKAVDGFTSAVFGGISASKAFGYAFAGVVALIDGGISTIRAATQAIAGLAAAMGDIKAGNFAAAAEKAKAGGRQALQTLIDSRDRTQRNFGTAPTSNRFGTISGLPLVLRSNRKPKPKTTTTSAPSLAGLSTGGGGGGSKRRSSGGGSSAAKKADREATAADSSALEAVIDRLDAKLFDLKISMQDSLTALPETATQADKLAVSIANNKAETEALKAALAEVDSLTTKSKKGNEKASDEAVKLSQKIRENQSELAKLGKEQTEAIREQERVARSLNEQLNTLKDSNTLEDIKRKEELVQDEAKRLIDNKTISQQEYFDLIENSQNRVYTAELALLDKQTQALKEKLEIAQKIYNNDKEVVDLQTKLLELEQKKKDVTQGRVIQSGNNKDGLKKEQGQFLTDLKSGVQSAFEQAITTALSGGGIKNALKQFADALKQAVISALAKKLSSFLTDGLFGGLGGQSAQPSGGSNKAGTLNAATQSLAGSVKGFSGILGKLFGGGKVGGTGGNAGIGRFFSGGAIGAGIGSIASSLTGNKFIGAGAGLLSGAAAGFALGGGPIGAVVGGLIGGIAGLFGGGNKTKKQQRAAKQEAIANDLVSRALNGADQNNLIDLNSRLSALLGNNRGLRGNAVRIVRAGAEQLRALIEQRKAAIEDFIKETKIQNERIVIEIDSIKNPSKVLVNNRALELKQLEADTAKLLNDYKDSEEAKTKILEQETLRRQKIEEEFKIQAKESVEEFKNLLAERDNIANQNVFQRRKSIETQKSEQIAQIDKAIAESALGLQEFLKLGLPDPAVEGFSKLKDFLTQSTLNAATLNVVVNGAQDPLKISEEITRAMAAFYQKNFGVTVV